jgi:hypothetical protein
MSDRTGGNNEKIERAELCEKIAELAKSLEGQYPYVTGILYSLSASVQISKEEDMYRHIVPFTMKQQDWLKKMTGDNS